MSGGGGGGYGTVVDAHYLRQQVNNLESKLEAKNIEIDQLLADIVELSDYIKDLETSLAEAHLMSVADETTKT